MKNSVLVACLLVSGVAVAAKPVSLDQAIAGVTATGAYGVVERLSAAEFGGRLTGTAGYDAAASWVARELEAAGLRALPEAPAYLQRFPLTLGGIERATMELVPAGEGEGPIALEYFKDFLPLLYSGSGDVTAEVVFVGYGITAPELGRDDYSGVNVAGKIVMTVRGAPADGRDWTAHDSHRARTANARAHGAAGYVFAESAVANPNGEPVPDLPMADVSEALGDRLLAGSKLTLGEVRKVLAKGGTASFATGARVRLAVAGRPARRTEGANVIAWLPGSDPALAREYVLLGAHLDHCGDWPVLLPGADDNASGSATLLEMARAAGRLAHRPRRSIVFVFFGGEEAGLLGSKHLASALPASLGACLAVINLDMVGAGTGAFVAGGKNFPLVLQAIEAARDRRQPGMPVRAGLSEGEARADHGPFQQAGIPAVSVFSSGGDHHGYHTPEDSIWWITPKAMEAIGRVVLDAAVTLADAAPSGSGDR